MFKDQPVGATPAVIPLVDGGGTDWNNTLHRYEVTASSSPALISYTCNTTASTNYRVDVYINGTRFSFKEHTGNVSNEFVFLPALAVGDYVDMRLAPSGDGGQVTVGVIANWYADAAGTTILAATATPLAMTTAGIVTISDQMPEQKVADFLSSLIKMFNLVLVPTSSTAYDVEPLDDWYAEGSTYDISSYTNIEEVGINRPSLYKRVSYSFNETEAILGEEYRLQNDVGYGDLRADFEFDGDEFEIEVGFDNMLFERLSDQNPQPSQNLGLTELNVGQCVTREEEPYIGEPIIFYASGNLRVALAYHWSYTPMGTSPSAIQKQDMWLIGNVNSSTAASVTQTINFGTEVDPYLLQGFGQSLYSTYWQDYITDLYDVQRRLFSFRAQLPVRVMLDLKANDKLTILERNYIINSVTMNLATGEAQLELLNDV